MNSYLLDISTKNNTEPKIEQGKSKGKVNACPLFGTGAMEKVTWMELDISVRIKPKAAGTV